jgi:hypothetical protein
VSLAPLLFIAAGIANELKVSKLRNEGVVVEGRILDGGELARPTGRKTHYLQVEFEKGAGEKVVKAFPVDRDDFVHANQVGKIPITYVPRNPALSRVGTRFGYNRTPLFVAIGAFVLIAGTVAVIQFLPKETLKAPQASAAPGN